MFKLPPNTKLRKDGSYEIRFSLGYKANGTQVRKSRYYRPEKVWRDSISRRSHIVKNF
jgi:hypothetical protein